MVDSTLRQQALQTKFTITPKTARMLMSLGYKDYRDLRHASPNHIIEQFGKLPGMTPRGAKAYRAAMRRLVFLATKKNPEDYPKRCTEWSRKGLVARGAWREDYDNLTGDEVKEILE